MAAEFGYTEIVIQLVEHNAAINQANHHNETPAFVAVQYGQTEVFKILAQKGANLNSTTHFHSSPFLKAIERAEIEILEIMAEYNIDFSQSLPNGRAPLEFAKECEHEHVINFLEKNSKSTCRNCP